MIRNPRHLFKMSGIFISVFSGRNLCFFSGNTIIREKHDELSLDFVSSGSIFGGNVRKENMKYALINGVILDGNPDMSPTPEKVILVDGEKITEIVDQGSDISGYEKVDLGGRYIMPGLINMHIHLPATGKPKKKESDPKKLVRLLTKNSLTKKIVKAVCQSAVQMQLNSGVTTVRTVGGVLNTDSLIRDEINAGKTVGPRILAANSAISVSGGHMAGSLAYIAQSADDARDLVDKIAQDKPDLVKLMITGGVLDATVKGEPGVLKMPPEYVKAACDEAHSHGFIVAAHVESPEGVRVALENGVDTIEHGAKADDEIISLFKKRHAALITTLSPALPYALFDRSVSHATELSQYNGKVVFEGIIDCAEKCLENDIPVGLGTDTGCPFITHYDMWRELVYFHKYCGVSNQFALYTATKRNAEIAHIDDVTGTVEAGKCADLIVTDKNPLDDLTALRNVKMVMVKGRLIRAPKLKKYKNVEQELDKFL